MAYKFGMNITQSYDNLVSYLSKFLCLNIFTSSSFSSYYNKLG